MVEPIPLFRQTAAKATNADDKDYLAFARQMAALAKRGGDAPESLTLDEIRELSISLELMYIQQGIG